jgi:hypothetical protein
MTGRHTAAYSPNEQDVIVMAEENTGPNYLKLALGAGLIAAAAIGVAAFVPRKKLAVVTEPLSNLAKLPLAAAVTAWAVGLWQQATAPQAPVFDDLRPFDEF